MRSNQFYELSDRALERFDQPGSNRMAPAPAPLRPHPANQRGNLALVHRVGEGRHGVHALLVGECLSGNTVQNGADQRVRFIQRNYAVAFHGGRDIRYAFAVQAQHALPAVVSAVR